MEKQLKCYPLLSLTEVSLRKVAALLWSSSDILSSMSKFGSNGYRRIDIRNDWIKTIEGKIKDKILKLELPQLLAKQMIDIVRPMGLQIKKCIECEEDENLNIEYKEIMLPHSAKLCWTMTGEINYKKMAEELVRSDELPLFQRYGLACVYCLEDYIPLLWAELDEKSKYYLYNKKLGVGYSLAMHLKFCWPHILKKGKLSKLNYMWKMHRNLTSFNQWAFEFSAHKLYTAATEYFFHKLTPREKGVSLKKTVEALLRDSLGSESRFLSRFRKEILCFLLSAMTPEQQMETIKTHSIPVMLCFLEWPLQDLFLENADLIWTILPPSCYADLLLSMVDVFQEADHYFPKLFQEFFIRSPRDLKTYFVYKNSNYRSSPAGSFLSMFFEFDDPESIKVIFRNVDAADRVKLVFDEYVVDIFCKFILNENWPLVALCVREAGLSKEEREKLNEHFMDCLENCEEHFELEMPKFKRFFEFLNETDTKPNKKRKVQKDDLENFCVE